MRGVRLAHKQRREWERENRESKGKRERRERERGGGAEEEEKQGLGELIQQFINRVNVASHSSLN